MMRLSVLFSLIVLFLTACTSDFEVIKPECGDRTNPVGIDNPEPLFSWRIRSGKRGFLQSAYQISVAEKTEWLGDTAKNQWNSGRISSGQSTLVKYAGKKLSPAKKYYWRVRVWDQDGNPSDWSSVQTFTTGLYTKTDWSGAHWIGYEELPDSARVVPGIHIYDTKKLGNKLMKRTVVPLFRKAFDVNKNITGALIFISGLGQYEVNINGKKVGNSFLSPGWTYYDKRVLYNVYDITDRLEEGKNALGVIVGNGFYHINHERYFKFAIAFGDPKMICKLQLSYDDGSTATIVSDSSWKTSPSPITYSSIFGGEDYDAQLEQPGWDKPDFNDSAWKSALLVKIPAGILEAEKLYPLTVNDSFTVKEIAEPRPGVYVYDFGQNASGIMELKVKGKKGQAVTLTPAELIDSNRLANQKASGKPHYYTYTLKGDGVETWRPRFSYYGFRYIQVEGAVPDSAANPGNLPQIVKLTSLHTSTSSPAVGSFECSYDLFNRIHDLIRWSIKSNLQSVVTDCPHREKSSWLEVDHLMGTSVQYNFDIYLLYKKLIKDMMDAQTPEGLVPDVAPAFVQYEGGFRDSPEWGSSSIILPWDMYKWYGDKQIIRTAYPMMKKYLAYLTSKSDNHIVSHGLGDWYDYGPRFPGEAQLTPKALTATAIYYYDITLLNKMADLLNDKQEASNLSQLAAEVKKAFNDRFYDPKTKIYSTGSQTAIAMPLCVGLVEEQNRKDVFQTLIESINKSNKALTAGDVGFHYLVKALSDGGATQMVFDMNARDDVPGYGFQLKKGATALTESWPALAEVSNNHMMLGHLMEWFYNGLAGIRQAPNSVGYKEIVIKPEIIDAIPKGKASFESPYGMISSSWKKTADQWEFNIVIPANTTATFYLPAIKSSAILENNKPLNETKGLHLQGFENGKAIIKAGSGSYKLVVKG